MSYKGDNPSGVSPEAFGNNAKSVLLQPGVDQIFGTLRNRRRRLILLLLKDDAVETKCDVMVRGEDMAEIEEMKLIHNHLPKLEESGYIEWNPATEEISKGPQFDEIEPLLELIETHADELPADWP